MDHLRKVQSGQKLEIPAATFNSFIDAAQDFSRRQRNISQEPAQSFRQASIVLVRNNSGTDRNRGEILGITSPVISPTDNLNEFKKQVALECGTPSPSTHTARFVVLLEPIASGKIGRAVIAGAVPAYIYVYEDCHEWADIHPAPTGNEAYYLTSGQYGGAQILWKESGTGYKWAVVRLFGPELIQRIELATDLVPSGSAYAYPLKPNGTPDTNPDRMIQVRELLNKHWGWGRNGSYYRGAWGYVKGSLDSDRWEVLNLEQMAHQICVTLTEDMGYTSTSQASCTVNDAYRGTNPTLIYYSSSDRGSLKVKDPQNLFPRALSGAKAKATWDNYSQEYHLVECQQMATMVKATATADWTSSDARIQINSSVVVMQPITGQSPETGKAAYDPVVKKPRNTFSDAGQSGDILILAWNETDDEWDVIESGKRGVIHWGKVQSGFSNASGAVSRTVSLVACRYDGSSPGGSPFNAKTPLKACVDTSLFTDYVVGWQIEPDGTRVIVTDIWDDPIGGIKAWDSTSAIRDGWQELTNAAGRFLVGCESGETWDDPGDTGGVDLNHLAGHDHDPHPQMSTPCIGVGGSFYMVTDLTHSEEDISPPWYAVRWIKRTS